MDNRIWRIAATALLLFMMLVAVPAAPAKALTGSIYINPTSGPVGTSVSVTGYGFSANRTFTVWWSGVTPLIQGMTTSAGTLSTNIIVPDYPRAQYPITVTTTAFDTSNIGYYTIMPTIGLLTRSSYVGDSIVVNGSGFLANAQVKVYFGTTEVATVTTTSSGSFSNVSFPVPASSGGTHPVKGTDASGSSLSISFTTLPKIVVSPLSGTVSGQVTVGGTGFHASSGISIYFDNEVVNSTQTNSAGTFANVTFNVPESCQGSHTLKAMDTSASEAAASFSVSPTMTISPTSGTSGSTVRVSGNGFAPSHVITVSLDALNVVTTPSPATSSSKGTFSASFTVPAVAGGAHQITASDGMNTDTEAFSVLSSLSLEPPSGPVGTEITVSGTGFQANQPVTITFDEQQVKTVNSDSRGRLINVSFKTPSYPGGTYAVKVSDGTSVQEASFTISTSASISQTNGNVGTKLTVSGVGFIIGNKVTITYDGNEVATTSVNTDGSFSTAFNVPASKGGDHIVRATDTINNMEFTFTMESTPPATPVPLKPEMDIKAKTEAYFDWEDVADPSGVTYTLQVATSENFSQNSIVLEETGLTLSEYTIARENRLQSVSKEAPYYWHVRAVDGASNASRWSGAGTFYVGFTLALPQYVIYIIIGIAAFLFAVFAFWMGRKTAYY